MHRPQRVSGLDASFLSLETATQPLQVFSVLELDPSTVPGGYSFEWMREVLAARVMAVPAFREKLSRGVFDLDHPAWVADSDFVIDRHVHRVELPAPGGEHELAEMLGRLAAMPLDRNRPLWEMWVIEGLPDEKLMALLKVHHAAADGVTYAGFLSEISSEDADPPPAATVDPPAAVGSLAEALDGLVGFLRRPLQLVASVLPATVRALADAIRRMRAGRAMAAPFSAPRTVLNARFTAQRNIATARLDLADVKKVKDHFGVKVNDVVATIVGGVVRDFLISRGELPQSSLVALEPVSVHGMSDRTARNQVSGMLARLHTDIADPVDRLRAVADANAAAKEQVSAISPTLLQDWGECIGAVLLGAAKRVYARMTLVRPMYNVVLSNVPGPTRARYLGGARIVATYPFGPVMHGAGLNFTLWSANGELHFGLISCPAVVPELEVLADGLSVGLAELLSRTGNSQATDRYSVTHP